VSICLIVCSSLCSRKGFCDRVSFIVILTYKTLISRVIILWLSSILSFARSLASVVESLTV
jgi:hypothetical protein